MKVERNRASRTGPSAQEGGKARKGGASFGFNDSWWWREGSVDQMARQAKKAGASVARVPIPWEELNAEGGWEKLDRIVNGLKARGIDPILNPSGTTAPDPDAFSAVAGELARRYPSAKGIEIWNEPNLDHFGALPPQQYADLLTRANAAVRAASPGTKVISAGLYPGKGWQDYQKDVLGAAKGDYVVGVHPYARGKHPQKAARKTVDRFENVDKLTHRDLWVTEYGFSSKSIKSQRKQGQALADAYEGLKKGGAKVVIAHRLMDDPTYQPGSEWEQGLGVIGKTGKKKDSFRLLMNAVRG